ncbi:sugar phosphate nucleotidyltransferase [Promethearchaeum syntrophicum]|uniref:Sugar phosphate nucleotidyltransferase n=1 Tax=Promethearchaeum syntrophicum TaxID=2594042 RepID=A0A5B9D9L1_9ARCH|nr:phosphocholine cytidylyltransferase family protein [Candidatus Prometheoarchaeum syntrophicum]
MKALILNSGLARRLKPLTDNLPKCLLEINGKSILQRQIELLLSVGVKKYIITTGPLQDKIINHVNEKFPELDVIYPNNPKFESTNYIYSMWLARSEINDDDILLLHGDLVFEKSVIQKIVKQKKSSAIVDRATPLPEKDFKGLIQNGKITKIGIDVFGEKAIFLLPLYYWTKEDFELWMNNIEKFVKNNNTSCYAENAFNEISDTINLIPLDIVNEFCMEIDTLDDLNLAKQIQKKL